jgi:hypothetical protein
MARKLTRPIPALALTPVEAAAAIGVGPDFFDTEIRSELRLIRRGRKALIPVSELERWLAENVERPVAEEVAAPGPRPQPKEI